MSKAAPQRRGPAGRKPRGSVLAERAKARLGAWGASGGGDMERRFRDALRHSQSVRNLRIAIPVASIVALVVVTLAVWLNPLRLVGKLPAEFGGLAIAGTKIMMEAPRMAGYTRDGRSYEMTAEHGAQDITKPDTVELTGIHGKVELEDKSVVDLSASRGIYDTKSETIALDQHIALVTTNGYRMRLKEAVVDTRMGHVVSNKPVEVQMTDGLLDSNTFEVVENGALLRFGGGVTMTINHLNAAPTGRSAAVAEPKKMRVSERRPEMQAKKMREPRRTQALPNTTSR